MNNNNTQTENIVAIFRVRSKEWEDFKAFCDSKSYSKAQGFQMVMRAMQLESATSVLDGQQAMISDLQGVMDVSVRILEICQNAEARAKVKFDGIVNKLTAERDQAREERYVTQKRLTDAEKAKEIAEKAQQEALDVRKQAQEVATAQAATIIAKDKMSIDKSNSLAQIQVVFPFLWCYRNRKHHLCTLKLITL